MNDDDQVTDFRYYRTVFSHDGDHRGWCVYEQTNSHLEYVDGPWKTDEIARHVMRKLNIDQGMEFPPDD